MASTLVHGGSPERNARPRSAESTQQNQRSRISAGSSNAGSSTPDPKHNARNPSRSAESTGARLKETPDPAQQNQRGIARPTSPLSLSACIGPARIGISRPTSPLPRPPSLFSTAEDQRIERSRVFWQTSTSQLKLVINHKHHRSSGHFGFTHPVCVASRSL